MERSTKIALALLLAPALFVVVFFVIPLVLAIGSSFELPNFTIKNYQRLVDVPVYRSVLLKTVQVGLITTVVSLLLAYPCAYYVSRLKGAARNIAIVAIMIPFMLSVLARNYVWIVLLADTGLVNRLLQKTAITNGAVGLMYNQFGVVVAMVNMVVPYIFFPVFGALAAIPDDLKAASASLGGNKFWTFVKVTLPLTVPGIAAGCLLTFIVSIGFYITPAMLGGTREMMIANLIAFNVKEVLNWSFAFSLSTMLLGSVFFLYAAYRMLLPKATVLKAI